MISMKKTWKLAFAAFAFVAFTACNDNKEIDTESENVETIDEIESDLENDMDQDTVMLQDGTVNDGVVDEIKEEQPPVQ
jgi:ATP-dependent protease ClpP protease subunit